MAKFQKGHTGRPKGTKNKKKILKVEDFVRDSDTNVAKTWWETIIQIDEAADRAKAMADFYKYVGGIPKHTSEDELEEPDEGEADVLSIINGNKIE